MSIEEQAGSGMALSTAPIYAALPADLRRFVARRVDDPKPWTTSCRTPTCACTPTWPPCASRPGSTRWPATPSTTTTTAAAAELPEDLAQPTESDDEAQRHLAQSLSRMVDCLPDKYREALVLTDLHGITQQALADRLGQPIAFEPRCEACARLDYPAAACAC